MKYQRQLKKVIDFIGQHLDEELSLESLSEVFGVSKFHFHRLFTAFTGLSLQQYIRWLRLKRAAHQLIVDKKQSIITIAINAGFESHEAFSRAFKKACGISPSRFRDGSGWSYREQPPYCLPKQEVADMNVDIKTIQKIRLAVVEHRGDPQGVGDSVNKLVTWAKAQPVSLKPKPGEAFAFAWDDPKTTPAMDFRMDLGLKVPENLQLEGVVEKYLPAGRYAVAMHHGSRENIAETVYYIYREWLPDTGEQLGDLPCVFCYYNFDHEVADTELLTECWFLLK
ncbi:AraC family transcriptional regulator [Legionella spiritensis]|uniref:AraC family transcriptional regulator n=1 Tax=Legionella spiritensis TaxID=452 RepID=UPI000F707CB9|nr:GyrI-like domain-containing protein [Legionella spiritensis]VEG89950.1 AraC family transcriptional regulator [Legionella spiritensis]